MDPQAKLVSDTIARSEAERIARMREAVATGTCFGIIGTLLILGTIAGVVYGVWRAIHWAL